MLNTTLKLFPEPNCDCFMDGTRTESYHAAVSVAAVVRDFVFRVTAQAGLCKNAVPLVLNETVLAVLTVLATFGTSIEQGSQEARWETERLINEMHEQLVASIANKYEMVEKLTPEQRESLAQKAREMRL